MMRDISTFLFKCDPKRVDMGHLEDFLAIRAHLSSLRLSVNELVNKLTTFIAALIFYKAHSTSLDSLKRYRALKNSSKHITKKNKQTSQ